MSYQLVLLPPAEQEIFEAAHFYESEKEGLGLQFLDELEEAKQKLSEHPNHYSFISADKIFRRYSLHRFPFQLIFEVYGNTVIINAVRHDKRKPFT